MAKRFQVFQATVLFQVTSTKTTTTTNNNNKTKKKKKKNLSYQSENR